MTTRTENLGHGRSLLVTNDYTFGTDALLLADFAAIRPHDRICDLGTGCGILPLLFHCGTACPTVDAVDCSPEATALAQQNVVQNGLENYITVHTQDWRRLSLPAGAYDRVVCNPPYFAENSGAPAAGAARRLARQEQGDTLSDVITAAARLLRVRGHFVLCHRPERLVDVVSTLRAHRLEPKRLQLVCARENTAPFLLLCDAVREAKPSLRVLPPLILESKVTSCQEP